ncbi:MAG: GNAT family N-acetyltransferase [Proteobacteria bacterium]|nr:GNAT family N-acetyltransferase [Pseudomonadota bacterium]
MALSFEVLRDEHALAALAGEWWALLPASSGNEPMLSPLWLRSWWRVFGGSDGRELAALVWRRGRQLVGVLPLLRRRHWYGGLLPFRRLELLASGEPERDEIASEYLGPILAAGEEHALAVDFAARLDDGTLAPWDELCLPAMREHQPWVASLCDALEARGQPYELSTQDEVHYVPLPASWDAYLAALSSRSRYLVRRSLRDTERWAGGELRFEEVTRSDQLEGGKAVLAALHGARWAPAAATSSAGSAGVFSSPRFRAFHDAVLPQLLERGALELRWMLARGEPIAALYNIVWNNKVYAYQSGRLPKLPATVRVGVAIHAEAIRRAIACGRREYDLLGGPARYKRQLGLATRRLVRLRVVQPRLREHLRRAAAWAAAEPRPWHGGERGGPGAPESATASSSARGSEDGAEDGA